MHFHTGDVQPNPHRRSPKVNGRLSSLSRFLPKLIEKVKPFYKLLKKIEPFSWEETCEQAFLAFKKTIATPPVLSRPRLGAPLLLYLSVVDEAVSSTLVQEEGKHQLPIYFTSRMLHDAEKCYQMIKKVALTLISSAWRLRPYFQSHQVVVKMNYPSKQVLRKLELAGRVVA